MKQESGYALYVTLLVIVLISILGITLLTASSNTSNTVVKERQDQSTYYLAEAGINLEKAKILQVLKTLYVNTQTSFNEHITIEEQQELLTIYGSFETYYNTIVGQQFCERYNILTNSNRCSFSEEQQIYHYVNNYSFSQQFQQQPISNTSVTLNCQTTPCVFQVDASGYFEQSASKKRELTQTLTVQINPTISGGIPTEENNNGSNGPPTSNPLENIAALTTGNITLTGGAAINGGASSSNGIISLDGGANITGNIHVDSNKLKYPPNMESTITNKITSPLDISINALLPEFPTQLFQQLASTPSLPNATIGNQYNPYNVIENGNFQSTSWQAQNYELALTEDTRFNSFTVSGNNTLYINVGANNINLYVEDLNVIQGDIKLVGTGNLNIFVNSTINVKGSFNKEGNPNQLNIFYNGTNKGSFSNETAITGTLYTHSSDLAFDGGASILGNIYSGGQNITITGGVKSNGQYIVAPNAKLKLLGGGQIKGTVAVKSIEGSGGTSIQFGQPVVPLPTLPSTSLTIISDTPSFIKESALKEI